MSSENEHPEFEEHPLDKVGQVKQPSEEEENEAPTDEHEEGKKPKKKKKKTKYVFDLKQPSRFEPTPVEQQEMKFEPLPPERRKTIVVLGSTGKQGSSVAKFLLKSKRWNVRAFFIDRKPGYLPLNKTAELLKHMGAELAKGSFADKEALKRAMKDAYGVFANVDFWKHPKKPEIEIQYGKNIADAAKECGIKHFVFSSKDYAERMTNGAIKVPQFDGKAQIAEYCREIGLPMTEVKLSYYMENFLDEEKPLMVEGGGWRFRIPMGRAKLDIMSWEDTGGIIAAIFENPDKWIGKSIGVAGDSLTGHEIASIFEKVTDSNTLYTPFTLEKFQEYYFPPAHAEMMTSMYRFLREYEGKLRDVKLTRELYPHVQTFEQWLTRYTSHFA